MSAKNVVEVSIVDGGASPSPEDLLALLDESETVRAERFLDPQSNADFVTARAALRVILGRTLGVAPREVPIGTGEHGKPALTSGTIGFNVSHAHGFILVALREAGPVGIDVETTRRRVSLPGMPRRALAATERRAFEALPPAAMPRAFLQAWSRKEAYAKGLGLGLDLDFRTIDVGWEGAAVTGDPPWEVRSLALPAPYVGAVAAPGSGWRVSIGPHSW